MKQIKRELTEAVWEKDCLSRLMGFWFSQNSANTYRVNLINLRIFQTEYMYYSRVNIQRSSNQITTINNTSNTVMILNSSFFIFFILLLICYVLLLNFMVF